MGGLKKLLSYTPLMYNVPVMFFLIVDGGGAVVSNSLRDHSAQGWADRLMLLLPGWI